MKIAKCIKQSQFPQILHLDTGDTLELRKTGDAGYINKVTFNIELVGLGFDYLV